MFRRILLIMTMLLIVGLTYLLGTAAGLKAALKLADYFSGDQVTIAVKSVEGRLLGDFVLHHAQLETSALNVEMNRSELRWSPGALLRGRIHIEQLSLAEGKVILAASDREDPPSQDSNGWLPDVSLEAISISSVQLVTGSDRYQVDSVAGSAELQSGQLTLSEAQLHMPGLEASMTGAVNLQQFAVDDLLLQWEWQTADLLLPVRGSATLNGDAETLNLAASLDSPTRSSIDAVIYQALTAPAWQAEFSMQALNLQRSVSAEMPDVELQLRGGSNGSSETASVDATGSVTFDGIEHPWKIDARVPFADDSYPELAINSGETQLTITPAEARKDQATIKLDVPDLASLWPGLSGQVKGRGELLGPRTRPVINLSMNASQLVAGEQSVERIELQAQVDSSLPADAPIQVTALVDKAQVTGYQIDGNLQLQGTPGDASLNVSLIEAGQGELQLLSSGGLANGTLSAIIEQLVLIHPQAGKWEARPGAELTLRADAGELSLACLQRNDASICGESTWQKQRVDARMNIKSLQLETVPFLELFNDYRVAGRLDGQLAATIGSTRVEKFSSDIEMTNGSLTHHPATGELRNIDFRSMTLSGTGDGDRLKLDLKLEDAHQGRLHARVSLPAELSLLQKPETAYSAQLDAEIQHLERYNVFLQQAILPSGQALAALRLQGSRQAPSFSGTASLHVPLFEAGEPATQFSNNRLDLQLDGTDVRLQGQSELAGRPLRLDGNGSITSLDHWKARFTARADAIPLAGIPAISLQDDFTLDGMLQADVEFAIDNQLQIDGLDAEVAVKKGVITRTFIDGETDTLALRELRITARNKNNQLLVSGKLNDTENGQLDMKLKLPAHLQQLSATDLALDGQLSADLPNLQAFGIFVDDVSLPAGRFSADISVNGSTAAPQVKGYASLSIPRLDLTEPAISFDDTQLDIDLDGNRLSLQGRSMINTRPLVLEGTGQLQSVDEWKAELRLAGESVKLDNVFGSSLQTSPDLELLIEPGTVALSGDIVVEGSEIIIRDLSSTIRPSSDVRLVGQENAAAPPWRISTDLGVSLSGENRLRVAGFDGLLGGSVRVRSETGKLASGEGALTVNEGTYRAFGATVPIRSGRLEFIGGALDDPAIRIESRRRVEQREVGFDVTGTLQRPVVTLVSNPSMDQSEILSYLLYGRAPGDGSGASTALLASSIQTTLGREEEESFLQRMLGQMGMSGVNVESDLTSGVGVSKQLSPRLFIKYHVDIWEQTNRLILRYHLNPHWALEGISGDEGGADILYERER